MSLDPALRARIEALLAANPVVLFMKGSPNAPQCGFSAKAAAALAAIGLDDYAHVDVLADQEIREGIKAYGDWPTIPQLYIGGELVGGSDIIEQMASSGELQAALGLPPPDRTPPKVHVSDAAAAVLRQALADAGEGFALKVSVDPRFNAQLQAEPANPNAIATEAAGIRMQFDLASARRAEGMSIEWVDDARGRGLVIENPNAPPKVRELAPADAALRLAAGKLRLVDVRPAQERELAALAGGFDTLDGGGAAALEALPKDTPLAFLCHRGGRSAQAAEHFRRLGFREVYNVTGGIDAWADIDPALPKY